MLLTNGPPRAALVPLLLRFRYIQPPTSALRSGGKIEAEVAV
jgi:hypothetical protein